MTHRAHFHRNGDAGPHRGQVGRWWWLLTIGLLAGLLLYLFRHV